MTPGRSASTEGNPQTPAWKAPRGKQETQKPPALAPLRASQAADLLADVFHLIGHQWWSSSASLCEFQRVEQRNYHSLKIFVFLHGLMIWWVMPKKCVERYCELANKTTQQLYKVSTPCIDDHHFKEEEMKSVGELSNTCSQIVLKCLYLARIGRPDILWSVNKFARSITKWTKACDKRLNRLNFIHSSHM